jgi:hypothetical protein
LEIENDVNPEDINFNITWSPVVMESHSFSERTNYNVAVSVFDHYNWRNFDTNGTPIVITSSDALARHLTTHTAHMQRNYIDEFFENNVLVFVYFSEGRMWTSYSVTDRASEYAVRENGEIHIRRTAPEDSVGRSFSGWRFIFEIPNWYAADSFELIIEERRR